MKCPECGKTLKKGKHKIDDFPTYYCTKKCGYDHPQCFGLGNHEQTCAYCPEETDCSNYEHGEVMRAKFQEEKFGPKMKKSSTNSDGAKEEINVLYWTLIFLITMIVAFDIYAKATVTTSFAVFVCILSFMFLLGLKIGKYLGRKNAKN